MMDMRNDPCLFCGRPKNPGKGLAVKEDLIAAIKRDMVIRITQELDLHDGVALDLYSVNDVLEFIEEYEYGN